MIIIQSMSKSVMITPIQFTKLSADRYIYIYCLGSKLNWSVITWICHTLALYFQSSILNWILKLSNDIKFCTVYIILDKKASGVKIMINE